MFLSLVSVKYWLDYHENKGKIIYNVENIFLQQMFCDLTWHSGVWQ